MELDRQRAQQRLDSARSLPERNRFGQFATPPAIAREIAAFVEPFLNERPVRFLDPAVGTGAFFSAFLARLGPKCIVDAAGVELDPHVARTARRLWRSHGLRIRNADFTRLNPPRPATRFDLVVANPPYVRHHHLAPAEKQRLRATVEHRTGLHISGLAGLYCHFLLLADSWLAADGLGVWLVPSEFFDVNYGGALREYLTRRVELLHVHRFNPQDPLFSDALVTSALIVFRNARARRTCTLSDSGSPSRPALSRRVPLTAMTRSPKWSAQLQAHAPVVRGRTSRLDELFTIRRGIATGANAFFIRDRREARAAGIPASSLRPLLPSARDLSTNIVDVAADGWPELKPQRALLDIRDPPEVVRRRHPALWRLLLDAEATNVHQRYLTSRRTPWYAQERRPAPLFLCTYMGRRPPVGSPFRFIWNRSQAVATNVYLLLQPKAELQVALERYPDRAKAIHDGLCAIAAGTLEVGGRVYGGGLHKLEPGDLGAIDAAPVLDQLHRVW